MATLQERQKKIQEKKKNQFIDDLILHIASWYPLVPRKHGDIISMFPKIERTVNTVTSQAFEEIRWSFLGLWIEYDSTISFFDSMQVLFSSVPQPNLIHFSENINANYAHCVFASKNIYMGFTIIEDVENCLYSFSVKTGSSNVYNSLLVWEHSDNVFMSKWVIWSYNIFYSQHVFNSSNVRFSSNMVGCEECLFCDNLDNKKYCIYNKEYTKEAYIQQKNDYLKQKSSFDWWFDAIKNTNITIGSNNVAGNFIVNSENIADGFYVYDIKDAKNVILVWWRTRWERIYDTMLITPPFEDAYGVMSSGTGCSQIYNSIHINWWSNIYYSQLLNQCSYCFGCIGLQNKQFCILNKQYTKDDRYEKVDEIFAQMEKEWTLGDFFPAKMNPFYFNDTLAYLIHPSFTKEEVIKLWYLRRDEPIKVDVPTNAAVVKTSALDQYEWFDSEWKRSIDKTILDKIILDEQGNYYKIVAMEYDFLVKHVLPLPRKHRLERLKKHFDLGLKQWS